MKPLKVQFVLVLSVVALLATHCSGQIESTDQELSEVNGITLYRGRPYTGLIHQYIPDLLETQLTSYKDGLKDGVETIRNREERLIAKRNYKKNKKDGIHQTWFDNGDLNTFSEFKDDHYINERWSWYANKIPSMYEKYDSEGNILVAKQWRNNGQIYTNMVFQEEGSSIGLLGSKTCKSVKEQKEEKL